MRQTNLKERVKKKGAVIGICVVLVMLLLCVGIAQAGIFDLFSNEIAAGSSGNIDLTTTDLAGVQAVAIPEPILLILLAAPIPLLYRRDKRT